MRLDELRGCIEAWRKTKKDCFELWIMQSSSKRGQEQQQVLVKHLKTQLPETSKLSISDEPPGPELPARFWSEHRPPIGGSSSDSVPTLKCLQAEPTSVLVSVDNFHHISNCKRWFWFLSNIFSHPGSVRPVAVSSGVPRVLICWCSCI